MPIKVDLKRLEETVLEYEKYPVTNHKILLYGSSFFTRWGYERSQKQLSGIGGEEIATINHGFGGSTGEEQLYYYHRLVLPYKPKMIVLRGCVNDLSKGYTPEEAAEFSMRLYGFARTDFPGLKFAAMTAFDFRSAPDRLDGQLPAMMARYNELMRGYAKEYPDLYIVDISPALYENPANVGTYQGFRDIFVEDGLHLNDAGYEYMAEFFKKELNRLLAL